MAERVSAYWVQFAKTGNPNPPGKHEWPAYDSESDKLVELGTQIAVREKFRKEQMKFHEIPLLGK